MGQGNLLDDEGASDQIAESLTISRQDDKHDSSQKLAEREQLHQSEDVAY